MTTLAQAWYEQTEPSCLVDQFPGPRPVRQLRLFLCACCRLAWGHMPCDAARNAVMIGELFAYGEAPTGRLPAALAEPCRAQAASDLLNAGYPAMEVDNSRHSLAVQMAGRCVCTPGYLHGMSDLGYVSHSFRRLGVSNARQCDLLREMLGSPFEPLPPLWSLCGYCGGRGHVGRGRDECPQCEYAGWWSSGKNKASRLLTGDVLNLAEAARVNRVKRPTGMMLDEGLWLDPHRLLVLADALEDTCLAEAEPYMTHLRKQELRLCQDCSGRGHMIVEHSAVFSGPSHAPAKRRLARPKWTEKVTCERCDGRGSVICHAAHPLGCWVVNGLLGFNLALPEEFSDDD